VVRVVSGEGQLLKLENEAPRFSAIPSTARYRVLLVEVCRYDKNGNVTNFVDRRGISVTFKYDTLDRRTGIVYAAGNSIRYLYDSVGRVTNINRTSPTE
jgi:YD repeat-containing protein